VDKSYWVFVEGTSLILTSGLAYKNITAAQIIIIIWFQISFVIWISEIAACSDKEQGNKQASWSELTERTCHNVIVCVITKALRERFLTVSLSSISTFQLQSVGN